MNNKYQIVSAAIKQQQEAFSEKDINENFSQPAVPQPPPPPPKVTVSLPKHAASRLRDLVQRRDIALLRLGIISVQFEDDQIIPLNTTNATQPKQQTISPTSESIIGPSIENCNADCIGNLNTTTITTLTDLTSSNGPIIEEVNDLESNMSTSESSMLNSSIAVATVTTQATNIPAKADCNTNNLAVVYEDDDEDDKDEDEVVSEVENQHSSYNIHQLSQLEFADPDIELEMYTDNDNLLFPDYTLNLS